MGPIPNSSFTALGGAAGVGGAVGTAVGAAVGTAVGTAVGAAVGTAVGVGVALGTGVETAVGAAVGATVGRGVLVVPGVAVGPLDGAPATKVKVAGNGTIVTWPGAPLPRVLGETLAPTAWAPAVADGTVKRVETVPMRDAFDLGIPSGDPSQVN